METKWLVSGCNFIYFVPQLIKIQHMKLLPMVLDKKNSLKCFVGEGRLTSTLNFHSNIYMKTLLERHGHIQTSD